MTVFWLIDRIGSEHNSKIVNLVVAEFDKDQYPRAVIKGMLSVLNVM